MKSRIALIAIGGMIAGMELSKHKKVIKDGVKNMIGKAIKAIGEVSEKREKTISKRIERLEEDRLDAIEESDFEKVDDIQFQTKYNLDFEYSGRLRKRTFKEFYEEMTKWIPS